MNPNPHEVAALMLALGRAGVELAPHPTDPARLRYRPANIHPELQARLRLHRAAILRLLVDGYTPDDPEALYVLGERLGMADSLEMPTHPGAPGWLVAAGASIGQNLVTLQDMVGFDHG